eukprot:13782940-Alexandrium_andersonii.AAC.1
MERAGPKLPELIWPMRTEVRFKCALRSLEEWPRPLLNQLPPLGAGSSLRLRKRRGRLHRAIDA